MIRLLGAAIAVVTLLGFAEFAIGPCAQASGLAAQDDAHNQWKQFRQTVGAHSQIIAVSKPYADGSRLIILAEPSPTLDDDAIERDTGTIDTATFTGETRIGVDGWVQDTLLVVPKTTDSHLADTLARLSLDAYGTTYQSIPVVLPLEKSTTPNAPLDLSIDASELRDLLRNDPQQTFYSIVSPTPFTLDHLLDSKNFGDYVARKPGFTILVLPRGADIDQFRPDIARFARESDLILGAIAKQDAVAIIARQRVADFVQIPPLRVEMILQLASGAKAAELGQSYDRNHILAGVIEGGKGEKDLDWAPIFLSELLIDTEYGSLLNIADQILKSWSNAGHTRYTNFDYRDPATWAFPAGLDEMVDLNNGSSLRYNWNTKGDYYRVKFGDIEVFALVRTGALPITYEVPGRDMRKEEDQAFDWFARQNDPILARVVQYTTLYEIFHSYNIGSHTTIPRHAHPERVQLLRKLAGELVDEINQFPAAKLASAPDDLRKAVQTMQSDLSFGQDVWGNKAPEMLAEFLGDPRSYKLGDGLLLSAGQLADRGFLAGLRGAAADAALHQWAARIGVDWTNNPAKRAFASALNDSVADAETMIRASRDAAADSIKTPWIVVSSNRDKDLTGGHTLDTAMARFEFSGSVPKGQPELQGDVILINPADADIVPNLSRSILRDQTKTQFEDSVEHALQSTARAPRTEAAALGVDARGVHWQTDSAVAGFGTDGAPRAAMWARPADPQELAWTIALGKSDTPTYLVDRTSTGFVMVGAGGDAVELPTLPNLQEYLTSVYAKGIDHPPPAKILFHGFQDGQVDALLRTTRLRYAAGRPADASKFLVSRPGLTPDEIARQFHWQYKWDKVIVDRSSIAVRSIGSGPLAGLHEVSLDAQIIPLGRPPFVIRILLYFRDAVPESLRNQIFAVVDRFMVKDASQYNDLDTLVAQLHLKLATEFPHADRKLQVNFDTKPHDHEAADISISDAEMADGSQLG
jgi:hypothetical protein